MKHRHHSSLEKKQNHVVHKSIRSSNSLRIKKLPSTSALNNQSFSERSGLKISRLDTNSLKNKTSIATFTAKESTINNSQLFPKPSSKNIRRRLSQLNTRKRCFFYKYCPCLCSRLCVVASIIGAVLLGILIAAITVALLSKTTVTSTTVTTTTTTTFTSTTTSVTTSTTTVVVVSIGVNDTLQGIWNASAGTNSLVSTAGLGQGNYVPVEGPPNAFDNNCNNKFLSFGDCALDNTLSSLTCGINTGFYVTLSSGAIVMKSLRFCTGNDAPERDPITMTLEGSNQTGSILLLGSSWTLIYNGSCGLDIDPGRNQDGQLVSFAYNMIPYLSYRILISSKRGIQFCVQYGEMSLFA